MNEHEAEATRKRTLAALAGTRIPGFHFAGYFLELSWPVVEGLTATQSMELGPHCTDVEGKPHAAAFGVAVDGALATVSRLNIEPGARLATVNLTLQYTGHVPRGALTMRSTLEGEAEGGAARYQITRGVLSSDGVPVCYATGTFARVPAPPDVKLAPLPWEDETYVRPQPLTPADLTATERAVVRAANAALARADGERSFLERFFNIMPKAAAGGASCRVPIGPQIGNRVGHVQGGILLGIAQATASAAVPGHPNMSTISAWYVSPGHGKALSVRSKVVHAGRSFAVVKTEVRNADRSLVLEVVSNHAARRAS